VVSDKTVEYISRLLTTLEGGREWAEFQKLEVVYGDYKSEWTIQNWQEWLKEKFVYRAALRRE